MTDLDDVLSIIDGTPLLDMSHLWADLKKFNIFVPEIVKSALPLIHN